MNLLQALILSLVLSFSAYANIDMVEDVMHKEELDQLAKELTSNEWCEYKTQEVIQNNKRYIVLTYAKHLFLESGVMQVSQGLISKKGYHPPFSQGLANWELDGDILTIFENETHTSSLRILSAIDSNGKEGLYSVNIEDGSEYFIYKCFKDNTDQDDYKDEDESSFGRVSI